jgi:hypothetical protein
MIKEKMTKKLGGRERVKIKHSDKKFSLVETKFIIIHIS